jgi:microcystin-dependent protein
MLDSSSQQQLVPVGTVLSFSGTSAPTGYLFCDGTQLTTLAYPKLSAAIGTSFGSTGSGVFNIPDLRGFFVRGTDNMGTGAAGRDPDTASRSNGYTGGNTGNNIGSWQGHAFQNHNHGFPLASNDSFGSYAADGSALEGYGNTTVTGSYGAYSQQSAAETRPLNIYLNYIIKY